MYDFEFKKEKLYFIPLGGAGHFGANFNLYCFQNRFLIADCGMGFADENRLPGVDITLPDIRFLEGKRAQIAGLVATHAHEDHIGGIPYLWPKLKCPIYTTAFTAAVLREKLKEYSWGREVEIIELPLSASFKVGPFECDFMTVTHSIPEPNALVIRAGAYKPILHTGDWKIDDNPVVGDKTDFEAQKRLSQEGVLAIIGDSTNAMQEGHSGSEEAVQTSFIKLFKELDNRIVLTCFSSNIARLKSIAKAAAAAGRHVGLVGRSLWRMHDCAKGTGHLKDCPEFLSAEEISFLPRDKVVIACTGSQGEPRSALARIAYDDHRDIVLEAGDNLIYSARSIPGNERNIIDLKNLLVGQGVNVIDHHDDYILHVSGHPNREELIDLYQRIKPDSVIPVHGEVQMLYAHSVIAKECQVPTTIIPDNGTIIEFDLKDSPCKVGQIETDSLVVDGGWITDQDSLHINNRRRLGFAGCCFISLVVDDKSGDLIETPGVEYWGVLEGHEEEFYLKRELASFIAQEVESNKKNLDIDEVARRAARRYIKDLSGKKPMTKVVVHRIS